MANKRGDTKKTFLRVALKMFAEQGYEAVSVAQIAQAVGVSAPALYKHYSSKQELFDAILEDSNEGFEERMNSFQANFSQEMSEEDKKRILSVTVDQQIAQTKDLFMHTLNDEYPNAFRKLLTVEQFHFPQLAAIYNLRYVEYPMRQNKALFEMMIAEGVMKPVDPEILAVQYTAPFGILVEACDREPERVEWALDALEKHIRLFNEMYRLKPLE